MQPEFPAVLQDLPSGSSPTPFPAPWAQLIPHAGIPSIAPSPSPDEGLCLTRTQQAGPQEGSVQHLLLQGLEPGMASPRRQGRCWSRCPSMAETQLGNGGSRWTPEQRGLGQPREAPLCPKALLCLDTVPCGLRPRHPLAGKSHARQSQVPGDGRHEPTPAAWVQAEYRGLAHPTAAQPLHTLPPHGSWSPSQDRLDTVSGCSEGQGRFLWPGSPLASWNQLMKV